MQHVLLLISIRRQEKIDNYVFKRLSHQLEVVLDARRVVDLLVVFAHGEVVGVVKIQFDHELVELEFQVLEKIYITTLIY